jgi:cysteine desulfurase/selenocysteine lyase
MVAHGLRLTQEDTVLCSANSHHSNLLPWLRRARVAYIDSNPLAALDVEEVVRAIKKHRPRVLAFGWASNVNGAVSPAAEICRVARECGVVTVVDAAQAAPHFTINVGQLDCDFLAFSGHKMLGPSGTGVLWGRKGMLEGLEPLVVGGGTVDYVTLNDYALKPVPHRLEPGTPNIGGIIGLAAAVDYLAGIGRERIEAHERELCRALRDALGDIHGMRLLMPAEGCPQVAIASVVPTGLNMSSDMLCRILSDRFKVMSRSGFQCAHPLFDTQGFGLGAVRLSAYLYNSIAEVEAAGRALVEISSSFANR